MSRLADKTSSDAVWTADHLGSRTQQILSWVIQKPVVDVGTSTTDDRSRELVVEVLTGIHCVVHIVRASCCLLWKHCRVVTLVVILNIAKAHVELGVRTRSHLRLHIASLIDLNLRGSQRILICMRWDYQLWLRMQGHWLIYTRHLNASVCYQDLRDEYLHALISEKVLQQLLLVLRL